MTARLLALTLTLALLGVQPLAADPCGMVPPIFVQAGVIPIERIGLQKTYVFYKDGIETFVIRPGYRGNVDNFGMLIPFPRPPAIRKVPDNIFAHVAAAVDPPEVIVDLRRGRMAFKSSRLPASNLGMAMEESDLRYDAVSVLREEAVGMYEVAVLEAGSAAALKRWMTDHGFQYPDGMDDVCEEYVDIGWCFVAVKTRVGQKNGVNPHAGMRDIDSALPNGSTFDGNVQAMGFRFESDEFVLPMRLSAFNEGELRNIVYILSDDATRINHIPSQYVVRQITGSELYRNLTGPLPVRVLGGRFSDIPGWRLDALRNERNPEPHNGLARDLFASDIQTVRSGQLLHDFEAYEKELLRIGERLGLRGPELDKYHERALADAREDALSDALEDLKRMTLTVVDGDFPREVIARENLTFASYTMWPWKNNPRNYNTRFFGPAPVQDGNLYQTGWVSPVLLPGYAIPLAGMLLIGFVLISRRHPASALRSARSIKPIVIFVLVTALGFGAMDVTAQDRVTGWIEQLSGEPSDVDAAIDALVALDKQAIDPLFNEALFGEELSSRGWAIVCLSEIGGRKADKMLSALYNDREESELVRTWAAAARVAAAEDIEQLIRLADLSNELPPLSRPISERVKALGTEGGTESVQELIKISIRVPQLQGALAQTILSAGPQALVDIMTTDQDPSVRWQATAYLATLGAQGDDQVAGAVVEAYRYKKSARDIPWRGGPLYVPGIQWSGDDARQLSKNLIRWMVFCERSGLPNESRQIENNLRSIQLAQAAGYAMSGSGIEAWLRTWSDAYGEKAVKNILGEQGVADDEPFRTILDSL